MSAEKILQEFEKKVPGFLGVVFEDARGEITEFHSREKFPAASLIKLPVLVCLLKQVEEKRLSLDEIVLLEVKDKVGGSGILLELHEKIPLTLLDLITLMIVISDNTATNMLIDRLGIGAIQKTIQTMGLRGTTLGRKLMVELEASPLNFTTPHDMFLLLKALYAGKLLQPSGTRLALDILSRQQYNEKIPLYLPESVKVMHKTGHISGVRHDCGILVEENRRSILCLLTKDLSNVIEAERKLAELSLSLYQIGMKRK